MTEYGTAQEYLRAVFLAFALLLVDGKPEKRGFWYRCILTMLGVVAAHFLELYLVSALSASPTINLICNVCALVVVAIVYDMLSGRSPWRHRLLRLSSLTSCIVTVNLLTFSFGTIMDDLLPGFTVPVFICVMLLEVLFALVMRRFSLQDIPQLLRGAVPFAVGIHLVIVLSTAMVLLVNFMVLPSTGYNSMIYFLLYLMALATYYMTWAICRENWKNQQMVAERQMLSALDMQIELTQENLQHIRKIRHDLKNQYAYMQALLHQGKYAQLEEALEGYAHQKFHADYYVDCGNVEISAILTMEGLKAWQHGMHLQTIVVVPPKLPFDSRDLLSILSNMIDNAIEANVRYGMTDDILVQLNLRNDYLYMSVANRLPEGTDSADLLRLKSAKGEGADHGLGTRIIREHAQACGGEVVFDVQDGTFIVEVMLDMLHGRKKQ